MVGNVELTPEQLKNLLESVSILTKQVAQLNNDLEAERTKSSEDNSPLPQIGDEDVKEVAMHTLSRLRASKEYQELARQKKTGDAVELAINYVLHDYQLNPPKFKQ